MSTIAGLLRLASAVICLIVLASFAVFAFDQVSGASTNQQREVSGGATPAATGARAPHESTMHKALDEAANELTSPFSGVTAGSSSEWAVRGVGLLLALVVYGFGLGYLARVLRVRV